MAQDKIDERPAFLRQITSLINQIRPILAGQPPDIVGAALADLTATWIAGYRLRGDPEQTDRWHTDLLARHTAMVELLIQHNGPDEPE